MTRLRDVPPVNDFPPIAVCGRCKHASSRTFRSVEEAPDWLLKCDCRCHVPWKIVMRVPVKP